MKNLGLILLGVWLIAHGLSDVFDVTVPGKKMLLGVLAVASGGVLLFQSVATKLGDLGIAVLGVWLVLEGLRPLLALSFSHDEAILGGLGVLAGILLLVKR